MGRGKEKAQSLQRKTRTQAVEALKRLPEKQLKQQRQHGQVEKVRSASDVGSIHRVTVPKCVGYHIANDALASFNYYVDGHAISFRSAKDDHALESAAPPMKSASMRA